MADSSLKAVVDGWSSSKHVPSPPLTDEQMRFLKLILKSRLLIYESRKHPILVSLAEYNPPLIAMLLAESPACALTAEGHQTLISERETLGKIVCAIYWRTTSDRREIYLSDVLGNSGGILANVEPALLDEYVGRLAQEKIIELRATNPPNKYSVASDAVSLTQLGAALAQHIIHQR